VDDWLSSDWRKGTAGILLISAGVYILWVLTTWLLEGRMLTFLRPEAVIDRIVYTLIANLIIGSILALWVIRRALAEGKISLDSAGFRPLRRTIFAVIIAFILGLVVMAASRPVSLDPVILTNIYTQVLTVTIAEVAVCWGVMGSITEGSLQKNGRVVAMAGGILVASVLFGIYHLGHSPPFNQAAMIAFLSLLGIVTSLVYFIGRDIYATIVFHNFLGCIGVMRSLDAAGMLSLYGEPLAPVLGMAILSLAIFIAIDIQYVRKRAGGGGD
jgi:hypothetical protein